jgi:hypothetical protein
VALLLTESHDCCPQSLELSGINLIILNMLANVEQLLIIVSISLVQVSEVCSYRKKGYD